MGKDQSLSLLLEMEEIITIPVQLMAILTAYTPFPLVLPIKLPDRLTTMRTVLLRWWSHTAIIQIHFHMWKMTGKLTTRS